MRLTEPHAAHDGIRAILSPRSVAFIGASDDRQKWGGLLQSLLTKFQYAGAVYPVNPKAGGSTIQGVPAFANIRDVPGPVDLAVISIAAEAVEQAIEDCVAAKVRAVMIVSAQFAETGAEGAVRQARVVAIAEQAGLPLLGPNCMGILNANERVALLNSTALIEHFATIPSGRIGVASQSGAIVGTMIARAGLIGAGFSSCATLGNQAGLKICDFFDYLVDDPATDVICLYIEGADSIERLFSIAERARSVGKPVLITKAGRTPLGQRAVASHTASLAGSYDAFVARCHRAGVLVQTDALQMILTAQALRSLPAPKVDGVALFSGSGGAAALATDALADHGLVMPELGAETRQALSAFVTEANQQLPYDLGAVVAGPAKNRPDVVSASMEPVIRDPAVGACVYVMTPQAQMAPVAALFTELGQRNGKPCLVANSASGISEATRLRLIELGVPFFPSVDEALTTIKDMLWLHKHEASPAETVPALSPAVRDLAQGLETGVLSEDQTKKLLAAAGIPTADGELAPDADTAVKIATTMGYPVVLKIVAGGVTHKSDMGGVKLNLEDEQAVRDAFAQIAEAASRAHVRLEGCLVQPMIKGDVELMIGAVHDPQYGPLVMVGTGGTLVELMKDVRLLPAPVSARAAEQALRSLRYAALLAGYRGREPADLPAVARLVRDVSVLAAQLGPRLAELDINPVRIQGARAVAADARARWVAAPE